MNHNRLKKILCRTGKNGKMYINYDKNLEKTSQFRIKERSDQMSEEDVIIGVILTFLGVFLAMFAVGIVLYILQGIGLFKIAKREGKEDLAWLAWIPIASTFLMTVLVEKEVHQELRGKVTMIYGIAFAASIVASAFIPFAGLVTSIVVFYAFYFIAKMYSTNPVLHLVISIVTFGIAMPIQIFIFRNRKRVIPGGLDVEDSVFDYQ